MVRASDDFVGLRGCIFLDRKLGQLLHVHLYSKPHCRVALHVGNRFLRHLEIVRQPLQGIENVQELCEGCGNVLELDHLLERHGDHTSDQTHLHFGPETADSKDAGQGAEAQEDTRLHPGLADEVDEVVAPGDARCNLVIPDDKVLGHAVGSNRDICRNHHGLEILEHRKSEFEVEDKRHCGATIQPGEGEAAGVERQGEQNDLHWHDAHDEALRHNEAEDEHQQCH
mmetsp:Transcript_75734/g.157853  ORF Transcript_75734/g.157853 Transcript_75734/m.157853 type:complete len:227 (+) Transcript_75734:1122-1802(+)